MSIKEKLMLKSLRENIALKIIALAISVMIWFYVSAERNPNPTVTKMLSAEIVQIGTCPEDLILKIHPASIQVSVTGPKDEVDTLTDNEIKADVSVAAITTQTTQLRVIRYMPPMTSPNVTIQGRNTVNVDVVPEKRKTLRIIPTIALDTGLNNHYKPPLLTPQFADVVGTSEDINRVRKLTIFIQTNSANVSADLPIKALDSSGAEVSSVHIEPETTHVDMDLQQTPASKALVINVPITGQPAKGFAITSISVTPSVVTIKGKPNLLETMTNVSTIDVSVDGLNADTVVEAPLKIPTGMSVAGSVKQIKVTLNIRPVASMQ